MKKITVAADINAPVDKVWEYYNNPEHVTKWNFADDSWHAPHAESDFRVGGKFKSRMEARDGSEGFDFEGTYDEIQANAVVAYTFGDRQAKISFDGDETKTHVEIEFDSEDENPIEMQQAGWQSILDRFKAYVEQN